MLKSSEVSTDQKKWLAKNVLDACDTAKKVTQDTLTITAEQVKGGIYTVNATEKCEIITRSLWTALYKVERLY